MTETPTFRLIYRSHNRIPNDRRKAELGAIFSAARSTNKRHGVTGALLTTGDWFEQTLEGDEAVVRDLYARIGKDARHERVVEIASGEVDGRGVRPGVGQRARRGLDADDGSGRDPRGEIGGDRAGSAADVEDACAGPQPGDQVGRGVGHRAVRVRTQDAGGVPVRVGLLVGAHSPIVGLSVHILQRSSHLLRRIALWKGRLASFDKCTGSPDWVALSTMPLPA